MRILLGIICVLFGGFGWLGQTISAINYPLAQRLGLQEKSEGTDPLLRRAETNTARWDSFVLWTLIAFVKEPQEVSWGGFSGYFADFDGYYWEIAWGPMFRFSENGELRFKDNA